VLIKTPDFDRNGNGKVDVFTHAKYFGVSGNYAGKPSWHLWTGSQNWSDRSLRGDEVTVHMPRRGVFAKYRKNHSFIWTKHSKWVAGTNPRTASSVGPHTRADTLTLH
jgi:phosphatidylserine/phosphatidylglycerophosphate/cardiolipin synthase-like enzyme